MTLSLRDVLTWPPGQQPWAKQDEVFAECVDEKLRALFCEQRVGKCAVVLGKMAKRYADFIAAGGFGAPDPQLILPNEYPKARHREKYKPLKTRPPTWAFDGLDALLVVAMPSGVPRSAWAPEIALRLPPEIPRRVLVWEAHKSENKSFKYELESLIRFRGLACLLANGEAIITDAFRKLGARFLKVRRALAVADETTEIMKTPNTKRSRVMDGIASLDRAVAEDVWQPAWGPRTAAAIGKYRTGSIERMILDGTPMETPFDLYQQFKFLDPKIIGAYDFQMFKLRYAEWEKKTFFDKKKGEARDYPAIKENEKGEKCYQRLDELQDKIAPYISRVMRKDCFDVPEKLYMTYRFDLSPEQRRVYDTLAEEYEAELHDQTKVAASHVLARLTRLQQVSSNYWPSMKIVKIHPTCNGEGCAECDDLGVVEAVEPRKIIDTKHNPRMTALSEILSVNKEPGIVWARFTEDIESILEAAPGFGRKATRYDGKVDDAAKDAAKLGFQRGDYDLFIANQRAGGRGLDLSAAGFHVYYSNGFPLLHRLQSEDRTEVSGRKKGTGVFDLLAESTVDEKIVAALVAKCSVADFVMRNPKREWFK